MEFREIVRTVELENLWELICMWQSMARDDLTVMHCHFFRLLWAADCLIVPEEADRNSN